MKRNVTLFFITVAVTLIVSCSMEKILPKKPEVAKSPTIDYENLIPVTDAMLKRFHGLTKNLPKYQFYLGPDGFDLNRKVDTGWSSVGSGGKMILTSKMGVSHIEGRAYTPVKYVSSEMQTNGTLRFKMDLGPVVDQSGKQFYPNTYIMFAPRFKNPNDLDHAYIMYPEVITDPYTKEKVPIVRMLRDIFTVTFPGDEPTRLFVNRSELQLEGDTLFLKGSRINGQ